MADITLFITFHCRKNFHAATVDLDVISKDCGVWKN